MSTILQRLLDNWIVLVVLICMASGVITTIATQVRKYGCHRSEIDLKRDLVERGLSVDEIERVIAAKSPSGKHSNE